VIIDRSALRGLLGRLGRSRSCDAARVKAPHNPGFVNRFPWAVRPTSSTVPSSGTVTPAEPAAGFRFPLVIGCEQGFMLPRLYYYLFGPSPETAS